MNGQKTPRVHRIGYGILSFFFAGGVTVVFNVLLNPSIFLILPVVFVTLWSGIYLFLDWLFVQRPERVKKNVPTTSEEWRRKQKDFYDSLPR
jgi:hypothetical protein